MLGWFFVVYNTTPEEIERLNPDRDSPTILARWETGLDGLQWLSDYVDSGRARQVLFNGYPMRYALPFAEVRPRFFAPPPPPSGVTVIGDDYVIDSNWRGDMELFRDRITACSGDQVVTVEAWDLS